MFIAALLTIAKVWTPPSTDEQKPAPIVLPGKFHGQRSLAGYSPWGCKEWDTTEVTWHICTYTPCSHISNQHL